MEAEFDSRLLNHRNECNPDFRRADCFEVEKDLTLLRLGHHRKLEDERKNKIADAFELIKMVINEQNLNRRTVESVLNANSRYYLIKNKEEIVGCIGFEVSPGKIDCIFIKPAFRRKGYMEKVLKTFTKNSNWLVLATTAKNKPINKLAVKAGFKATVLDDKLIYQFTKPKESDVE